MSNYFIIDQINPHTGEFDEHKLVKGATIKNAVEAALVYLSNYEPNWQGLGAISEVTPHIYDLWLKHGNRKQPFSNSDFAEKPLRLALVGDAAPDPSKSRHWITTETGSHILINGNGEVVAGAGGKLAGKKFSVPAGSKDVSKHIETVEKIAKAGHEKHGGDYAEYLRAGWGKKEGDTKKSREWSSAHFAREYEKTGNIPEGHLSAAVKSTKERIEHGELNPTSPEAFKEILKNPSLLNYYKDDLEPFFEQRAIDIYNDLLSKGWKRGSSHGELENGNLSLKLTSSERGVQNILVDKSKGEWIDTEQENIEKSTSEFADMINKHLPEGHLREAVKSQISKEQVFNNLKQNKPLTAIQTFNDGSKQQVVISHDKDDNFIIWSHPEFDAYQFNPKKPLGFSINEASLEDLLKNNKLNEIRESSDDEVDMMIKKGEHRKKNSISHIKSPPQPTEQPSGAGENNHLSQEINKLKQHIERGFNPESDVDVTGKGEKIPQEKGEGNTKYRKEALKDKIAKTEAVLKKRMTNLRKHDKEYNFGKGGEQERRNLLGAIIRYENEIKEAKQQLLDLENPISQPEPPNPALTGLKALAEEYGENNNLTTNKESATLSSTSQNETNNKNSEGSKMLILENDSVKKAIADFIKTPKKDSQIAFKNLNDFLNTTSFTNQQKGEIREAAIEANHNKPITTKPKAVKSAVKHDLSRIDAILQKDKIAKATTGSQSAKLSNSEIKFLNDIKDKKKLTEKQASWLISIGKKFYEGFYDINVIKPKAATTSKRSYEEEPDMPMQRADGTWYDAETGIEITNPKHQRSYL